jgi:hypothetical protein
MEKVFKNIEDEIAHHLMMVEFHSKEATQLLKKKGNVSTFPAQTGKFSTSQELRDQFRARARRLGK